MKLWDSLTTCLILLSAVRPSSLLRSRQQPESAERREGAAESPLELPPVQIRLSVISADINPTETAGKLEESCKICIATYFLKIPNSINTHISDIS